jgi:hypothetical protein
MKQIKQKKCRNCKELFTPYSSTSVVCSPRCALDQIAERREKMARKDIRERKQALKSKSDWLREAQTACNAYIRERDGKTCISCGTQKPDTQYAAGHYKTRGSTPAIRFHPMNINSQCNQYCNLKLSGNIIEYRPNLIKKIGIKAVDWLEGPHQSQNLTIDDIKDIKAYYKEQLKLIKNT